MNFRFSELVNITNNFSDEQKVGSGGYGTVYKGMYNGDEIAVKKLHGLQGIDDKAFDAEFRNLSKVNHKNIIRLIGYSHEARNQYVKYNGELVFAKETDRALCFEYMQCGSLDDHIADDSCGLDWPTCYEIIKGTCEGLNHLHHSQEKPIYHLDLKPSNILLDRNMTAKIADLGLSRLVGSTKTHITEKINGTLGYMPPEYGRDNLISKKFDVFSLGVIIIKIMVGKKGRSRFPDTMGKDQITEIVCENWSKKQQENKGEIDRKRVKKCVEIALRCMEDDRKKRPLINEIVRELEQLEDGMKMSRQRSSSGSNVLAVDPVLELRFLFETSKDITTCLQITNMMDDYIAFNTKANSTKYRTQPTKGVMQPCSKRYISVTLIAQEEGPKNMHCDDMLHLQTAKARKDIKSDEITEDFFERGEEKVVDVVSLPIVYVAPDQLQV